MASCRDESPDQIEQADVFAMPGKDSKSTTKPPVLNRAFALRMLNPMRYQEGNKSPLDKELKPVKDSPKKKTVQKKQLKRSESYSSADDEEDSQRSRSPSICSNPDLDSTDEYIYCSLTDPRGENDRPLLHRTMSAIGSFTHGSIRSALSSNGVQSKRDKKYMKVRFADNNPARDTVRDVLVRGGSAKNKAQRNPRVHEVNSTDGQPERHSSPREDLKEFRTESAPPDIGYPGKNKELANGVSTGKMVNGSLKENEHGSDSDDTVVGEDDVDNPTESKRCLDTAEGANDVKIFENENQLDSCSTVDVVHGGQLVEACPDILVTSYETGDNTDCQQTSETVVVRRRNKDRPYGKDRDEFAKRLSWVCNLLSERCPGDFQVLEALVEMQYAYERREDEVNKSMSELKGQVKEMEHRLKALELFTLPGFSKVVMPMSDAAGALYGALQSMSEACRVHGSKEETKRVEDGKSHNSPQNQDTARRISSPETPV